MTLSQAPAPPASRDAAGQGRPARPALAVPPGYRRMAGAARVRRTPAAGPSPAPPSPPPLPPGIYVAGAHGGAGASTLAALLRAEIAAAHPGGRLQVRELPAFPDGDPRAIAARAKLAGPLPGPLVLAARGTGDGARRAVVAVTALSCLGIRPAALAVVGDGAGPLPRIASQRLGLIGDRAGPVVTVPFAASLRAGAAPAEARLPRSLRRQVTALAGLAAALLDGEPR